MSGNVVRKIIGKEDVATKSNEGDVICGSISHVDRWNSFLCNHFCKSESAFQTPRKTATERVANAKMCAIQCIATMQANASHDALLHDAISKKSTRGGQIRVKGEQIPP